MPVSGTVWGSKTHPASFSRSGDLTTHQVKIWDPDTAEEIMSIPIPDNAHTIGWSRDGTSVMISGDGSKQPIVKRVWRSTDELIAHAYECCVSRELTPEERAQFGLPERSE